MAKPSDTPGFKKLLAEWNKRLEESGFKDIEKTFHRDENRILKDSGNKRRYERLEQYVREAKYEFYTHLSKRVSETRFEKDFERQVLTLYSQGYSQASIKRMLGVQGHRCKVYYPVYRWLKAWGLK